jgi:hypothetical protein
MVKPKEERRDQTMKKILFLIILLIIMFLSVMTLNIIIIKQQERIDNITKELEIVDVIETEKGLLIQIEIEENVHNYLYNID